MVQDANLTSPSTDPASPQILTSSATPPSAASMGPPSSIPARSQATVITLSSDAHDHRPAPSVPAASFAALAPVTPSNNASRSFASSASFSPTYSSSARAVGRTSSLPPSPVTPTPSKGSNVPLVRLNAASATKATGANSQTPIVDLTFESNRNSDSPSSPIRPVRLFPSARQQTPTSQYGLEIWSPEQQSTFPPATQRGCSISMVIPSSPVTDRPFRRSVTPSPRLVTCQTQSAKPRNREHSASVIVKGENSDEGLTLVGVVKADPAVNTQMIESSTSEPQTPSRPRPNTPARTISVAHQPLHRQQQPNRQRRPSVNRRTPTPAPSSLANLMIGRARSLTPYVQRTAFHPYLTGYTDRRTRPTNTASRSGTPSPRTASIGASRNPTASLNERIRDIQMVDLDAPAANHSNGNSEAHGRTRGRNVVGSGGGSGSSRSGNSTDSEATVQEDEDIVVTGAQTAAAAARAARIARAVRQQASNEARQPEQQRRGARGPTYKSTCKIYLSGSIQASKEFCFESTRPPTHERTDIMMRRIHEIVAKAYPPLP